MKQKQRPVDNRIAETAPMTRVILVATFIQYVACPKPKQYYYCLRNQEYKGTSTRTNEYKANVSLSTSFTCFGHVEIVNGYLVRITYSDPNYQEEGR